MNVPNHVAIILDGNGRWAKKRGMPRNYGHLKGSENVERILEEADALGIRYLTVYAFSTENWSRPEIEVKALMKLFREYLSTYLGKAMKNNVRVRIIGDRSGLDEDIISLIDNIEKNTSENTGINFTIAINYGSRDEMIRAMKRMALDVKNNELDIDAIDEAKFSSYLDTCDIPDPDLMIRTSGEQRLSNYLMWQMAYTEFYFTDVPWPAFTGDDLKMACEAYNDRDRRYGKV